MHYPQTDIGEKLPNSRPYRDGKVGAPLPGAPAPYHTDGFFLPRTISERKRFQRYRPRGLPPPGRIAHITKLVSLARVLFTVNDLPATLFAKSSPMGAMVPSLLQ